MKPKSALLTILIIAIVGMLFSGYLAYGELFKGECTTNSFIRCGSWSFANLPACVYGLVMYAAVFIISLVGYLHAKKNDIQKPLV
ncbi:MAG: hypothetical protein WC495_01400 [Patescibacteria group bacterium]|jgi:ABC-type phosphate transport system permease subunit